MRLDRPARPSSASWLTFGYALLIVYASLYPFGPWDWPAGLPWQQALRLPWPRYWLRFDVWANALGYLPLGFLLFASAWRSGRGLWLALALALVGPALLAYALELTQYLVVRRVPSLGDWVLNSAGAAVGALLGAMAGASGLLAGWARGRERWFEARGSAGLALLALWPLGLVFPLPLPLAQGQLLPPLQQLLAGWLLDTPWAGAWPELVGQRPGPGLAVAVTALGLLAPCLLMLACSRPGWHRLWLVLGALGVGVGMTSLSAALGHGPSHAWAWPTQQTLPALGLGLALALPLCALPARVSAVLALPVLSALIVLVNGLAADVYWQQSLVTWEQGALVKLYGLTQWLGWLWPWLSLAWLSRQLMDRGQSRPL